MLLVGLANGHLKPLKHHICSAVDVGGQRLDLNSVFVGHQDPSVSHSVMSIVDIQF